MNEHTPVLADHVIEMVKATSRPVETFMDATFGRGGHAALVLQEYPRVNIIAIDQDLEAIEYGREQWSELVTKKQICFIHNNFSEIKSFLGQVSDFSQGLGIDVILLDLGVSSPQLDQAQRGFSFYQSGPLDMRMNQTACVQAKDIINGWGESELIELFKELGEVKNPRRVVQAIIEQRKQKSFETTEELACLISKINGWRKKGRHPATQYFLALRLKVNQELEVVKTALPQLLELLNEDGRLLVISFHSLEDRIVKYLFKDFAKQGLGTIITKKVIQTQWAEQKKNPRARSAKLRVFEKRGVTSGQEDK